MSSPPPMPHWARTWLARRAGSLLRAGLLGPVLRVGCHPFVVRGSERLLALDGPFLLVGNHSSYLDAPVLFRALPPVLRDRVAAAMATEPFEPLFSGRGTRRRRAVQRLKYVLAVTAFQAYPLPRSSGFRASLQHASELADAGVSTLLFPEGGMTRTGAMAPFRGGVGLFARQVGVPVVPFRIRGLFEVLPPGRSLPRRGPVSVTFGEPLRLDASLSPKELAATCERAVIAL